VLAKLSPNTKREKGLAGSKSTQKNPRENLRRQHPLHLRSSKKGFVSQFSITTFSISKSDASPCDAKLSITTFGISKSDASLCDANCTFLLQKILLWKTKR